MFKMVALPEMTIWALVSGTGLLNTPNNYTRTMPFPTNSIATA